MVFLAALAIIITLLSKPSHSQEACYYAKKPHKSSCALPDLWSMRQTLCTSSQNWGEGFPFLSGHGLVLSMKDNCTADNDPLGIDIRMTISSTVKDRDDCFARTKSIIERCVEKGSPTYNGGEWYDLEEPDKTFIWMQYFHIDPPPPPNPCYEYPPPPYCTAYPYPPIKPRKDTVQARKESNDLKERSLKGTHIDVDVYGNVLRKRFFHMDGTVEKLV
ncbi:hypothetical protein CC78DRAFT_621319 [Lojkania enalia]|uniref:Uncharacterized protein n=1 Tax=Lojkania enalia TaxID=147567 RepID=A0A9P4MVI6_9PLEO|nr:hypothetical protein CC78DRAFT_621319 [Didymosphaeria enalia]